MNRPPAASPEAGSATSARFDRAALVLATRALDVSIVLLALLLVAATLSGGLNLQIGTLRVTARDPQRLLLQLTVVSAVRALVACSRRGTTQRRLAFAALVGAVLLAMVASSHSRLIGDGQEYLAMSWNMAHLRPPALSASDARELAARFGGRLRTPALRSPGLIGRDGRADQVHFWMYSVLAAPFLAGCERVGVNPLHAFTAVNVALILMALWLTLRILSPALALLLISSPVLWWIDKAHTEVFTVAMLTIALALLQQASPWALLPMGLAAAQNPPIAAVLLFAFAVLAWRRRIDRWAWMALVLGGALCLSAPLYYARHLGTWSPLTATMAPSWPTPAVWLAPVTDPNLGIAWQVPILAIVAIGGVAVVRSSGIDVKDVLAVSAASSIVFLAAFAQAPNVNHGGTLGPSRYGLWLVPLLIPALAAIDRRIERGRVLRGSLIAAAGLWFAWACYAFHPKWPENSGEPSGLAAWVWTHTPALDNPLPEVFSERLSGSEVRAPVPIGTGRCEKVLIAGRGAPYVQWPVPCRPVAVPRICQTAGVLCYANGTEDGYGFTRAPVQRSFSFIDAEPTWTSEGDEPIRGWLARLGGHNRWVVRPPLSESLIVDSPAVVHVYAVRSERGVLAWLDTDPEIVTQILGRHVRPTLHVDIPRTALAVFIDPATNTDASSVRLAPGRSVLSPPDLRKSVLLLRFDD
jgi:hypothetical protein